MPHDVGWGKLAGFGAGFVVAWLGFALRAAVLPDTSTGRAVAAFLVVGLIAVGCSATSGVVPLWSGLLGSAALVAAYEQTYTNAPSQFLSESPTAVTSILLAVALGYLALSLLYPAAPPVAVRTRRSHPDAETRGLDDLMMEEGR